MLRLRGLCAAALAIVAAITGCGEESERDQLEQYLNEANVVLEDSGPEFKKAQRAYKKYSQGKLDESAPRKLEIAADTILTARRKLEELSPPEVAEKLDRRLLDLFDLYAAFSRETARLAVYLPEAASISLQLTEANRKLNEGLEVEGKVEGQTTALTDFAASLDKALKKLEDLKPPEVLAASNQERIDSLTEVRELALQLEDALSNQDAVKTASLLVKFRKTASEEAGSEIDRSSLKQYERRFERLQKAQAAVKEEEARLAARLADPAASG